MSSVPIHTGHWIDWSHGRVLGEYMTYDVRDTQYIIGGTSAFVTFVGGCVWALYAFFVHQRYFANEANPDLITLQHRLICRNDSTPAGAVTDAFWIYWWWKPWTLCWPPRRRSRPRAKHVGLRTCTMMAPALLLFASFAIASVFSSRIAVPAYRNNTVLVEDNSSKGKCGITLFDGSLRSVPSYDIKSAVDTHSALSYARSCYSSVEGFVHSVSCSSFVTTALSYTRQEYVCPFGDPSQSFAESICAVNSNNAAHHLATTFIDSHHDLGINAPSGNRVQLRKNQTCSPLSIDGFTSIDNGHGSEANTTVTNYNYGGYGDFQTYTYQYNPAAAYDNVPFEIFTVTHNATGRYQWQPVPNISRDDADITLVFVAPNAVKYRKSTIDPFFKSTYNVTELTIGYGNITVYSPDYRVSVMGCIEQYSICNGKQHCTPVGGQQSLAQEILSLNLNPAQFVTAQRMIYMIGYANLWSSINGIGPDALKVWNQVYNFISPGLLQDQWKLEVEGWLETTLAKWQAFMVEFAYNNADAGPAGYVGFPVSNSSLDSKWRDQCASQKISNLGFYQNVSVFGFAFTWAIGSFLILLSWFLKLCISGFRDWEEGRGDETDGSKARRFHLGDKSKARRDAWNIDGKLQQNRLALLSADYTDLIGGRGDVPYLDAMSMSLPFKIRENEKKDTYYASKKEESETQSRDETSSATEQEQATTSTPRALTEANGKTLAPQRSTASEADKSTRSPTQHSHTTAEVIPPIAQNVDTTPDGTAPAGTVGTDAMPLSQEGSTGEGDKPQASPEP